MSKLVFKTEPKVITHTYEISAITDHLSYIYKSFIELRGDRPKDKAKFAKCPACQKKHLDNDRVYFAFDVIKDGKHIGNRFACEDCFKKYGDERQSKSKER